MTPVTSVVCTCGTLLELLIFLFPPLPGLEDAPQAGQLAVPADRWSVDPRHQATRSQHPLLVHQLYCSYCKRKNNNSPGSCINVIQQGELDIAVSNRLNLGSIKVLSPV